MKKISDNRDLKVPSMELVEKPNAAQKTASKTKNIVILSYSKEYWKEINKKTINNMEAICLLNNIIYNENKIQQCKNDKWALNDIQ